jgi:hypothetical protein
MSGSDTFFSCWDRDRWLEFSPQKKSCPVRALIKTEHRSNLTRSADILPLIKINICLIKIKIL